MRRGFFFAALLPVLIAAGTGIALAAQTYPPLQVTSTSFADGGAQPADAAGSPCGGANVSPELQWSGAPAGTKSFAVTEFDRDAPFGFWHWLEADIPPSLRQLPAGSALPPGAIAGTTSYDLPGYRGPCPPPGSLHHYVFTVSALDIAMLPGMSAAARGGFVARAMAGHILAQGSITGTFQRP